MSTVNDIADIENTPTLAVKLHLPQLRRMVGSAPTLMINPFTDKRASVHRRTTSQKHAHWSREPARGAYRLEIPRKGSGRLPIPFCSENRQILSIGN